MEFVPGVEFVTIMVAVAFLKIVDPKRENQQLKYDEHEDLLMLSERAYLMTLEMKRDGTNVSLIAKKWIIRYDLKL